MTRYMLPQLPRLTCTAHHVSTHSQLSKAFSTSLPTPKKNEQLPPRPNIPDDSFTKKFLKGSGPGGQKINKTSSAVQLTHVETGMVVKSQATRSRTQNEHIARRILAEKLELIEKGADSRVAKKQERASRKKRSAEKKSRRKYRKLAEGEAGTGGDDGEEVEGEDEMEQSDVRDIERAEEANITVTGPGKPG